MKNRPAFFTRLSFLLMAVLLAVGMAVLPVSAAAPIMQGSAEESYVVRWLLILIAVLLVCILLLILLTLHARRILKAHGLWGRRARALAAAAKQAPITEQSETQDEEEEEESSEDDLILSGMPMMANVDLLPEEDYIPHMDVVTVEEAESLVKNEVALHHIEHHHIEEPVEDESNGEEEPADGEGVERRMKNKKRGKAAPVNIDKLDRHYHAGDLITLARLREDGLVPPGTRKLKILAHGSLSKPLSVEADAFSLTAVKMILLTGGTPILLD